MALLHPWYDMSQDCQRYHSKLAELISSKKQENYATTVTWIRTKVSFAILRTALVCLRGTRSRRRKTNAQENDFYFFFLHTTYNSHIILTFAFTLHYSYLHYLKQELLTIHVIQYPVTKLNYC